MSNPWENKEIIMIISINKKQEVHQSVKHLEAIKLDNIYKSPDRINEFLDLYYKAKNEDQKIIALLRILIILPHYYQTTFGFNEIKPVIDHWLLSHDINDQIKNNGFSGSLIHFSLKNIQLFNYLLDKGANILALNSMGLSVINYYENVTQLNPMIGYCLDLSFYDSILTRTTNSIGFDQIQTYLNLLDLNNSVSNTKIINKQLQKYLKHDSCLLTTSNILQLYSNQDTAKLAKKLKVGQDQLPLFKDLFFFKDFKINNYEKHQYLFQLLFNYPFITEAMQPIFLTSSKLFKKAFFEKTLSKKNCITLDGDVLSMIKFTSELFLMRLVPNHSDFIEAISTKKGVINNLIPKWINSSNQRFLLSLLNNFTDSQKKILLSLDCDLPTFRDTLNMYSKFPRELNRSLSTKKWNTLENFSLIHDFFCEEYKKFQQPNFLLNQEKFFVNAKFLRGIKLSNGMYFNLADDQHELIDWGNKMGHCIGTAGYGQLATEGNCLLIAVMKDKEPVFAIEIRDFRIAQIQGKNHSKPEPLLMNEIENRLKKLGIIN
jgi:hypothetical protein